MNPAARLTEGTDGDFYGTTYTGGAYGLGTVFKLTPAGALTVLHAFAGSGSDGNNPQSGLIQAGDGAFYGTTTFGGAIGGGTIYRVTSNGDWTLVHSFLENPTDGYFPCGDLILGRDGSLYGLTQLEGQMDAGCIFRLDL